jgi:hypothetical protein
MNLYRDSVHYATLHDRTLRNGIGDYSLHNFLFQENCPKHSVSKMLWMLVRTEAEVRARNINYDGEQYVTGCNWNHSTLFQEKSLMNTLANTHKMISRTEAEG